MADITDQHDQASPADLAESPSLVNGSIGESRGVKRQRPSAGDDDDDDDDKNNRERRKIEIKFINDKSRRHITFSKRKAGIMKKAYELSVLTGTQVLLLVVSETGLVYTFTTPKLQPLVTKAEGKNLIQACLNAPEPPNENGTDDGLQESPDDTTGGQQMVSQPPRNGIQQSSHIPAGGYMPAMDPVAYSNYMQQQQQPRGSVQYAMPPHQGHPGHPGPQ